MKTLFIVESKTKAISITKWLPDSFIVMPSEGHICDIENTFNLIKEKDEVSWDLNYTLLPSANKLITVAKKSKNDIVRVILATDFDREGEVISFNIKEVLKKYLNENVVFDRIILREITESSLKFGMQNSIVDLNLNLVSSQETRRILDKMIGYTLSPLVNKFLTQNNSVGRVQSVSLLLITERTKEHYNFKPESIFELKASIKNTVVKLSYNGKKTFSSELEINELSSLAPKLYDLNKTEESFYDTTLLYPLKTSTLQKFCFNIYKFSAERTMSIAQKLFEGKKIDGKQTGIITYPRTDSTRVFSDFFKETKEYIKDNFTTVVDDYFNDQLNLATKKQLNIQDAHECIRPSNILFSPEVIKDDLEDDEYKVYNLIYYSFLASCFKPAKIKKIKHIYVNNLYGFSLEKHSLVNEQAFVIPECKRLFLSLPNTLDVSGDKVINIEKVEPSVSYTRPKSLYNEISLISVLEKNGIGRPSTYSSIIPKLINRKYIEKNDNKLETTYKGEMLYIELEKFFSNIFNLQFTQDMENQLQDIVAGDKTKEMFLNFFVDSFRPFLNSFVDHVSFITKEGKILPENVTCFLCGNNQCKLLLGMLGPYTKCFNKHNIALESNIYLLGFFYGENLEQKYIKPKRSLLNRLFFFNDLENKTFYLSKDKKCLSYDSKIKKWSVESLPKYEQQISEIQLEDSNCSYIIW